MADPVRETPEAPTGRDRLTQIAFALDAQSEIADRPGQMVALQNLAAEVREIAAGYAVVRLPEVEYAPMSSGVRVKCGSAEGGWPQPGLPWFSSAGAWRHLADARAAALDLLAVVEAVERATSPAETDRGVPS